MSWLQSWLRKLKRRVAPGLRAIVGGRTARPDAGVRRRMAQARVTRRRVVNLAWPIATAMLGDTAMGLVDTRLVGGLGAEALAGVGMGTTLMWLSYSFVFGVMRGVKVRTAHAVGEGRVRDATRFALAGACMGACVGIAVWVVSRDATTLLRALQVDLVTLPYARSFLAARTYGAVGVAVMSAMVQYRQGIGDTRTPMLVGLVGNVINAMLAYGLIYGRFGLPALGVAGAGYGTAITETLQALALVGVWSASVRRENRVSGTVAIPFRQAVRDVAKLGVPTGLHFGTEMLAFTTFTAILGALGAQEIAGHQVAMAVIRTSFLPGMAVAESASILVGRSLGARRIDEADRVTRTCLQLAVGFMTVCGIAFALWGTAIARSFTHDARVVTVVRHLLLVAAVFQALDAVNMVLRGALRGAKDVRVVAYLGATIVWCCIPTSAFVLGRVLGWGALGGWCGFVLETTISAAVFSWRWRHGAWRVPYEPARAGSLSSALTPGAALAG